MMGNTKHSSEKNGILSRQVAIVTASTDGIGFAIARRLAQDGAHVVLSSRRQENVDRAVKQLQSENLSVTGITCDAGKEEDRQRLVNMTLQTYGGIDILVCGAAVNPYVGKILESKEEHWRKILDVNVISTFLMVKLVAPHMEKRGSGAIVLISSITGFHPYVGTPHRILGSTRESGDTAKLVQRQGIGPYGVSKAALFCLTKALTSELAQINIRINCVTPGLIKTKFSNILWGDEEVSDTLKEKYRCNRIGEPEECAGIVSFLCSKDASYIAGENIVVAGGAISRL